MDETAARDPMQADARESLERLFDNELQPGAIGDTRALYRQAIAEVMGAFADEDGTVTREAATSAMEILDPSKDALELPAGAAWDLSVLLTELKTWSVEPPIQALTEPGPIGAENLFLSMSGGWAAVRSFAYKGEVFAWGAGDHLYYEDETPFEWLYGPDATPEEIDAEQDRALGWMDDPSGDDNPEGDD